MPKQPVSKKTKASPPSNVLLNIVVPLGVIVLLFLSTYNLHTYIDNQEVLGTATENFETEAEIVYWEEFLQRNERYIDGWLELAKLNYDAGDIQGAIEAINIAEEINPNSKELLQLKKAIN